MQPTDEKPHLAKAFGWSTETPFDWTAILGSAFGMAVPILIGAAAGNLPAGLAASVGGLLVGGIGANRDWKSQLNELIGALMPAAAASIIAALVAGHGWLADALVTLLAGAAAALIGFGRRVATIAVRFILLLLIAVTVTENTPDRGGLLLLMAAGALWTSGASLLIGALLRMRPANKVASEEVAPPELPTKQRVARWRRSLARFAGWQYPLRLMLCLAIAGGLRALWPDHHLHWIALTVALLAERQIDAFPVRTTQRALGAALGVLATGLLILYPPPAWAVVVAVGVLAGLRPLLRARNFLAYTAVMTPLIILLLDMGRPPEPAVLIDRLVATLVAAGLVIATNLLFRKLLGIDAAGPPTRA